MTAAVPQPARCVCPEHADARTCWEMRYYGFSPATEAREDAGDDDECECSCHDGEDTDEWNW